MKAITGLPRPGDRVRIVESPKTSNWSRIDNGRTGIVQGIHSHQWRSEPGPRIHVLVRYDLPLKRDGNPDRIDHYAICQVEILDRPAGGVH